MLNFHDFISKNMSLGENSGLVLILIFRVKSSVICVRLLLSHHVLRVTWFKALCYRKTFICTSSVFLKNRNTQGRNASFKQMFLNTGNIFFCYSCILKNAGMVFSFLFAFWEFRYYHIQVSVTASISSLNALVEDVCTLSKKPAGMPQIVSVLFMTEK